MNFNQLLAGTACDDSPHQWFCTLADQLIDNNYDQLSNGIFTRSMTQEQLAATTGNTPAHIVPQPTKSLDKKQPLDGTVSNSVKQLDCKVCKKKTTMTCNVCSYPVALDGSTSYISPTMSAVQTQLITVLAGAHTWLTCTRTKFRIKSTLHFIFNYNAIHIANDITH
jgi:hypothetical protein